MYSDLYTRPSTQKIPSVFIVSLVALFALVAGQVFVWYADVPTQASPVTLVEHAVVNVTDVSAGIYFQTSEPARAYVLYGTSPDAMKETVYESGSIQQDKSSRNHHYVEIMDLSPERDYYYQIIANETVILKETSAPYAVRTRNAMQAQRSNMLPIYGKLTGANGEGVSGALVLASFQDQPAVGKFMAMSKASGEWLMTIPGNVSQDAIIQINIVHENHETSHIQATLQNAAPLPQTVVMGRDYVFLATPQDVLPASTQREPVRKTHPISILYPEKQAIIPQGRPLLKGFGIPLSTVLVRVDSRPMYEERVVVSEKGVWVAEPVKAFAPGTYTLSAQLVDNNGQLRIIDRAFTIAKSGEQVLGESAPSTPSATLMPTRPITPLSSPTGVLPSSTPVISYVTATPGPNITVTVTPSALMDAGAEIPLMWIVIGSIFVSSGVYILRMNPALEEM